MNLIALLTMTMISNILEYNFGEKNEGSDWMVIVDGVMGGLSTGRANLKKESIYFEGEVSLENNGGFSSLRAPYQKRDLSSADFIEIKYRSKGISCAMSLDLSDRWWETSYKLALDNTNGEWKVVQYPMTAFMAYQRGRALDYAISKENLARVLRIGFMTNEKRAGAFELEVDYFKFESSK